MADRITTGNHRDFGNVLYGDTMCKTTSPAWYVLNNAATRAGGQADPH